METKEHYTMSKCDWGDGPWQSEPDKMQWQDAKTGLPCLIVRNAMGSLCGYVGVAEGHKYFGRRYDDPPVEVHGGLTYSAFCMENIPEDHGICHTPAPGEPDRVWWFGFDCGHALDLSPQMEARMRHSALGPVYHSPEYAPTYKNIEYVKNEVANLASQLQEIAS